MNRYKYRRNKNKGFTLAELLIVVAITIILAAVGFIAIFQYQQNLKFTEMENDAREVFLAAQNSLTSMKENGVTLTEHGNKMTDKIGNDASDAPSDLSDALKNAGIKEDAGDYWRENRSHFRYVSHKAGEEITEGSLLDQILDFGSIDETIRRDGSYIIEYDEDTYTVYGVFYSDSNQIRKENVDLSDNKYYSYLTKYREDKFKEDRKKFGEKNNLGRLTTAGYYGAATDNKEDADSKNLKQPEILIYNSGKITFKDHANQNGNKSKAVKNTTVKADEADYSSSSQLKNFNTSSEKLQNELKDTLSLTVVKPENNVYKVVVRVSGRTSGNHQDFTYLNGGTNRDWDSEGGYIYLKLDDITKSQKNFAQLFNKLIPGEDVSVSVHFETKKGTKSRSVTLPANSLFDSVQTSKDKDNKEVRTALIRSPRQLQNLEPDISAINKDFDTDKKKNGVQNYTKISQVLVEENIDWNWNGGKETNNQKTIIYKDDKGKVGDGTDKQFLSINNSEIKSFDGNNSTISNLNAVKNSDGHAGLFSKTSGKLTIQNLTLESPTVISKSYTTNDEVNNAGSLIGSVKSGNSELLIENVVIKDPVVTSSNKNAGGLIGKIDDGHVTLTNVEINADKKNINVTGEETAGGVIGSVDSGVVTVSDISVDTSNNKSIVVSGQTYAGGLIGYFAPDANSSVTSARYEGGQKGLVKTVQNSAGGLIGRVESKGLTITNSYASTYVYTDGKSLGRAAGFIGNIATKSGTITISNSFYGGRVKDQTDASNKDDTGYDAEENKITSNDDEIVKGNYNIVNNGNPTNNGNQTAGGFIGTIRRGKSSTGNIQIDNCYTTGSVYVKNGYAGGFLGFSSQEDKNDTFITLTNNYSTGIVSTSSANEKNPGSFVGKFIYITSDSKNNHDLDGMNSSLQIAGGTTDEVNTQPSADIISSVSEGTDPFISNNVPAEPYAASLNGQAYPFKAVATDKNNTYIHIGDWPIAPALDTTGIKADNGNKLTFHFALPEGTDKFTVAVTGQTSGKTYYVPMQIVAPDSDINGKVQHIHWDSFTQVANGSDWFWINNQTPKIMSDCKIARIESKQDYDAVKASDSISNSLPSSVSSSAESSANSIFIAMDLDDISTHEQSQEGPFADLFRDAANGLIPGENITVRVLPKWEYNFNLNLVKGASANSIFENGSNGTNEGEKKNTALIANARHLENLDNNVSDLYRKKESISFNKAVQTDNIIWKSTPSPATKSNTKPFIDDMIKRNGTEPVSIYGFNHPESAYTSDNNFYPISNNEIKEFDGGRKSIENVNISLGKTISLSPGGGFAAIFTSLGTGVNIHDLTVNNINVNGAGAYQPVAGIIASVTDASISNVSLTGNETVITVASGDVNTGGIVGMATGTTTINNCTVKNVKQISKDAGNNDVGAIAGKATGNLTVNSSFVEGKNTVINSGSGEGTSAGGLLGSFEGQTLRVNGSSSSVYVYSYGHTGNAGGLVGNISSSGGSYIEGSYVGGHTTGAKYVDSIIVDEADPAYSAGHYNVIQFNNGNAGGLIGHVSGNGSVQINSSYSTASSYGATSGGFIGKAEGNIVWLNNTYSIGKVNGPENANLGAYIGSGPFASASTSYYLSLTNPGMKGGSTGDYIGLSATDGSKIRANRKTNTKNATPYDAISITNPTGLSNKYPFKLVSELDNNIKSNNITGHHYGDWYDPDNENILVNPHTVQFFNEDGTPLTAALKVNEGSSVAADDIPNAEDEAPEGQQFVGWYNNNTDFTDANKISGAAFSNVTSDIKAYAHYVTVAPYVNLHYVNPTDNTIGDLGVAKINDDGTVEEPKNIKNFGGYTRVTTLITTDDGKNTKVDTWNTSADGKGTSYRVQGGKIQIGSADVKDLYLLYQPKETVNITLEIRADDEPTYPLIYHSYIHEYTKGEEYKPLTQSLDDFLTWAKGSSYQIEKEKGIKKSTVDINGTLSLQDVDSSEASLNESGNAVTLNLNGTADDNKTYVVLCKGKDVSYTISHIFYNSKGNNGNDSIDMPENLANTSNADKIAWINSQITYSQNENDTFTVVEKRTAKLGEYIDLEKETLTNSDGTDTGYEVTLNPDNNFVLNQDGQQYSVNYYRKEYNLTVDTDGAEVIDKSPFKVHFGEDISANSNYLTEHPKDRTGYSKDGWAYTVTGTTNAANTGTDANGAATMPAENITATAQWKENPTASYTVEVWTQKVDADQTPGMDDAKKQYDFYGSFQVASGNVNSAPDFLNDENATNELVNGNLKEAETGLKYFSVNKNNTLTNNDSVKIGSDGKTVYRVFYDRKTITFNFNYRSYRIQQVPVYVAYSNGIFGRRYYLTTQQTNVLATSSNTQIINNYVYYNGNRISSYIDPNDKFPSYGYVDQKDNNGNTIKVLCQPQTGGTPNSETHRALYGQKFPEAEELFEDYTWQYNGNQGLTSLMNYILPDGASDRGSDGTTLTLTCTGLNNGTAEINHYQEQLDGTWKLTTKTLANSYSNFTLTNKYDGFEWFGYNWGSLAETVTLNDNDIQKNNTTGPYNNRVLNIFHKRNKKTVTLENVISMKGQALSNNKFTIADGNNIEVPYEQKYRDIGLPTDPKIMNQYIPKEVDQNLDTTGYTFGGWYTSATFAPGTEFNPEETMPNHNIRLYAKWIAPHYTVTYKDGDAEDIGTEYVDRFGHITLTDDSSIAEKTNGYTKQGSTFVGWYEDKELTKEYLPSRAVISNLTLYAKYDKAPGTQVTYTVKYVYEGEDGSEAAPTKTVTAEVGNSYEERPLDIPNAISLDVRHSGIVAGDMDGKVITFRYRMYTGSNWTYTVTNHVIYKDLDKKVKDQEASLPSGRQSTTNSTKLVHAENINGYVIQGDTSKSVTSKENNITFDYNPDYNSLKINNTSVLYGDSASPAFTGMDEWKVPEGWNFETRTTYKDSSGNSIEGKPQNVGKYKADVSLYLVNGNQSMRLYTREVTYRILKKSIVITSADGTWPHDGTPHSASTATQDSKFADGDEANLTDFATIQEVGSVPNEFTVENSSELKSKYNIYRKFGTLTINPVGTTNEESNSSAGD